MLSGVSHDLRTPLTRLRLGLALMPQDAETLSLQRDVADMERMVEEFLAFVRGDAMERAETVDAVTLAQDVVAFRGQLQLVGGHRKIRTGKAATAGDRAGAGKSSGKCAALQRDDRAEAGVPRASPLLPDRG
ncbi:MAG TPA: histidine kinase dimerization/phospho-acceptor domain-containing protein [Tabrizicola sp.]|nr:histidine kinase dimerization/phospho-acceptor domain-containing protein [Tabrizicola sp.]